MTAAWQPLIDGLLEALWVVDAIDLRIIAANRAAASLLGSGMDDLIGRPVLELAVTPEDQYFWEDVAYGLTDRIFSESLLTAADGRIIQVDRLVSPIQTESGGRVFVVAIRDRSDQRRVEDELERLIAELRATLESTADGILVVDLENGIRGFNQRFAELWDLPQDLLTGRDDEAIYGWMGRNVADKQEYAQRLRFIGNSRMLEARDVLALRSGKILERVSLPQYSRGEPIGRVFSYRDITHQLSSESRLHLAARVFEASLDGILVTDSEKRVIEVNASGELLTGFRRDELMGNSLAELIAGTDADELPPTFDEHILRHGLWRGEIGLLRKDGGVRSGLLSLVRVSPDGSQAVNYVAFVKDLSERDAASKKIDELAFNDTLTGLPNRILLGQRLEFALAWATRETGRFAVLFLDLDRFKHINDSLGHAFGDRILVEVAQRIKSCLRQSDTAARLGGDEFVLILHDADERGAESTARRILESLAVPFAIDEMTFTLTSSIGIALYPADGTTADDLIKNADTAMYRVKDRGRAGFRFYQQQMNIDLLSRMKLDQAMRVGLGRGDFRLHYQPQVDLATGCVIGAEALLRWRDPDLGEVTPARFIPVAEEGGFIVAIGDWVLDEAVRQAAAWHQAGYDLIVAVNVSALQFQKPGFVRSVSEALAASGLPAAKLELELTESILVRDADEALNRLQSLAELGVKLSIDDFGTGYSSLMYLKRFPIHKLKIDRSFVDGLPTDDSDVAIVRAIVSMGQALRLEIIAEGVETPEQRAFLAKGECHQFQGFLYSPAVAPAAFEDILRRDGVAGRQ